MHKLNSITLPHVHVFASDVIPFPGCPRSAGGNRSWQVILALEKAGFKVTYSFPLITYVALEVREVILDSINSEILWCCENHFDPNLILNTLKPDVAIFCNINEVQKICNLKEEIILIADLYGPIHIEGNLMRGGQNFENDCFRLVENFRKIDYITTVSYRQKFFWSAYLSLAGFSLEELDPLVCPLSIDIPRVNRNPSKDFNIVFSGGFYPWQCPDRFLEVAAEYLDTIPRARLHIFGGPHKGLVNEMHVNEMLSGLTRNHPSVLYHGYRPVEELIEALSCCWCALELMERNIERELAITGRTVEFLSMGTPVIYNDYSSISTMIEKYDAGWTISTGDTKPLIAILDSIYRGGLDGIKSKSEGAITLAAKEFSSNSMFPLVNLLLSPIDGRKTKRSIIDDGTSKLDANTKKGVCSRLVTQLFAQYFGKR